MTWMDELDVILRQTDGKVIATVPLLGLLATGDSVETAVANLKARKMALQIQLNETGETEWFRRAVLRESGPIITPGAVSNPGLGMFAAKTAVVMAIIAAILIFLIGLGIESAQRATKFGRPFWSKVENELSRAADARSDLPEAKKQKILADIRTIVMRWRPFVAEIGVLFKDPREEQAVADRPAK